MKFLFSIEWRTTSNKAKLSKQVLCILRRKLRLTLNKLGLVFIVLGLTITTVACSKKTADPINGADNPSAITSPQLSNENTPATPSTTPKPSTSYPATPSPTVKASSKITNGDEAAALVKEAIFNNNEDVVVAYNVVESYNGFQCYPVKASSKSMQANGGSGTIGTYDVEIESGRIWDLSTNKIAIPN